MPNQQELKKRLYAFYDLNKEKGDRFIKNHFLTEGYNLKTISRFIKDAKNNVPLGRKKGRGKKPTVTPQSTENESDDYSTTKKASVSTELLQSLIAQPDQ